MVVSTANKGAQMQTKTLINDVKVVIDVDMARVIQLALSDAVVKLLKDNSKQKDPDRLADVKYWVEKYNKVYTLIDEQIYKVN